MSIGKLLIDMVLFFGTAYYAKIGVVLKISNNISMKQIWVMISVPCTCELCLAAALTSSEHTASSKIVFLLNAIWDKRDCLNRVLDNASLEYTREYKEKSFCEELLLVAKQVLLEGK